MSQRSKENQYRDPMYFMDNLFSDEDLRNGDRFAKAIGSEKRNSVTESLRKIEIQERRPGLANRESKK